MNIGKAAGAGSRGTSPCTCFPDGLRSELYLSSERDAHPAGEFGHEIRENRRCMTGLLSYDAIRKQMRHTDFSSDRGDVYDASGVPLLHFQNSDSCKVRPQKCVLIEAR